MAFSFDFWSGREICERCHKRPSEIHMKVAGRRHENRNFIDLCFECLNFVHDKATRYRFVIQNPKDPSVTDKERTEYLSDNSTAP